MTERVRPKLAVRGRRSDSTACPQGHEITGYNALPRDDQGASWKPGCRACMAAFNWARRHNLFNDDPRTVERANQLPGEVIMPTLELADKMTVIADELRKLPDTLPELRSAIFASDGTVMLVPKTNWRPWEEVRQAIAYAEHFGVDLDIILSYSGRGRAVASFTLAGNVVTVDGDVNSAHAYELGRVLGCPLDAVESVTVTPARLREVIDELAPAATS